MDLCELMTDIGGMWSRYGKKGHLWFYLWRNRDKTRILKVQWVVQMFGHSRELRHNQLSKNLSPLITACQKVACCEIQELLWKFRVIQIEKWPNAIDQIQASQTSQGFVFVANARAQHGSVTAASHRVKFDRNKNRTRFSRKIARVVYEKSFDFLFPNNFKKSFVGFESRNQNQRTPNDQSQVKVVLRNDSYFSIEITCCRSCNWSSLEILFKNTKFLSDPI